jgi:hypothetical protein
MEPINSNLNYNYRKVVKNLEKLWIPYWRVRMEEIDFLQSKQMEVINSIPYL